MVLNNNEQLRSDFQLAMTKIKSASSILVIGHVSPDPDAIASIGVILELAKSFNIKAYAFSDKKKNFAYSFIPNEEHIESQRPENLADFSVIIVLDCGSMSRTGLELELSDLIDYKKSTNYSQPFIIEFDHHEAQDSYADLEIRLPEKASTTEVLYDFLQVNNFTINKNIADCILTGLMADTGNFLHSNSSFGVMAASSEMLLKGSSILKISSRLRGDGNISALKIWGAVLSKIKFNPETGFACSALTRAELNDLISEKDESKIADLFGDIVSFISYISGVRISLFLREDDNQVKGSLRTNYDDINVAEIAKQFGGGGHKRAAGFVTPGKLKETETGWNIQK